MKTAILLGDVEAKGLRMLEVACRRCDRRGKLRLARLVAEHGPDMDLPTRRMDLAGYCPHAQSVSIYDKCQVHFPQLPRLFYR
jgi:hypothetical protein